jgi:hypothetical protein
VISGFDRLVFRGTLRRLYQPKGMEWYLCQNKILIKDYGQHVEKVSAEWKESAIAPIRSMGRVVKHLNSCRTSKEELARHIAAEQGIRSGPVCALTCVEPCQSFRLEKNKKTGWLEPVLKLRQCVALYLYSIHPEFGWMNARIQTWFPFAIHICWNGREWLSRQMDREQLGYQRHDNCFSWMEDYQRAQQLLEEQLKGNWPQWLDAIAHQLNPIHAEIFRHYETNDYWSCHQSEWATDLVISEVAKFQRLYPLLVDHAMNSFSCTDVMRFLGRKIQPEGPVPANFSGQVGGDLKHRREGTRIKFRMNQNSIKAYDKAHTENRVVFRAAETTINNTKDFRVWRPKEGEAEGEKKWRQLRKGNADLHRRAEVSQAANARFIDALASVDDSTKIEELLSSVQKPIRRKEQRVRALRPMADDGALLEAVNHGEFTINGLRNRDLQRLLFSTPAGSRQEKQRRSAAISRKLRMLREHGLIKKVPRTHRYQVTAPGRSIIAAVLTVNRASVAQLNRLKEAA